MRKTSFALGGLGALLLGVTALPAAGDTTVRRIDNDTLMVIDYSGKPPFKRRFVDQGESPVEFARFEEMTDGTLTVGAVSRRSGPPGKSLPGQRARVTSDAGEIAEFARFEESGEESSSPRMWRGAPGKGRPLLGD